MPLAEWVASRGGNYGEAMTQDIADLNRFRAQPGISLGRDACPPYASRRTSGQRLCAYSHRDSRF